MATSTSRPGLLLTSLRWPVGLIITGFDYTWRTTPAHRRELEGAWPEDAPPHITSPVDRHGIQGLQDGVGDLLRRRYRVRIRDARTDAAGLMRDLKADPNTVAPGTLAHFAKTTGEEGRMELGDEFTVRMPGPWDGPIRVIEIRPTAFRFATLEGHLEAGQIEWRARDEDGLLAFEIESWSRPGDRLSAIAHHKLRMAKEVQLHMWTSVLEKVVGHAGGRRAEPLDIDTRRLETPGAPD